MRDSCNYIDLNGRRCDKTYQLHEFYFRDPYHNSNCFSVDLCKWHADAELLRTTTRLKELQLKLTNLIAESARLRRIAKENDTYANNETKQQRIEDLKELIKKVQSNECKNDFCNQNLRQLENKSKLYSCHIFKPSGRRWYSFYFCSEKCFNIFKGRCGIETLLSTGQTTLL